MNEPVDFGSWVAGWTALVFVVLYGVLVIGVAVRTGRVRRKIGYRILVSGSRGKSGTVRLLHAALFPVHPTYGKITGTAARELFVDGTEKVTRRLGSTSVCEMSDSIRRAASQGATIGIFECMAVTPKLIQTVQQSHVLAQMVIIPTIRLDHLEEEGLTIEEIARSIIEAMTDCEVLVTGAEQESVLEVMRAYCRDKSIEFLEAHPDSTTPLIPGHHPTNVAIALAVAQRLGVSKKDAISGMHAVSLEPGALSAHSIQLSDGYELALVDLGGANDPESASEALRGVGLPFDEVVPILVNRWERPLRSVAFFGSLRGHFPVVGIAGSLYRWMRTRHQSVGFPGTDGHEESTYFPLTFNLARDPEKLASRVRGMREFPGKRMVIILMENVHETSADLLRRTFEQRGTEVSLLSLGAQS